MAPQLYHKFTQKHISTEGRDPKVEETHLNCKKCSCRQIMKSTVNYNKHSKR